MSAIPNPSGFLMHETWRPDAVLTRKIVIEGGRFAPGKVRALVAELLAERLSTPEIEDVLVLVSELVTNAVRHAGADESETIIVHVAIAPEVLRVEVCDQGPGFDPPAVPQAREDGSGGNGLVLLACLSSSWGVAGDDGTCVWFERELAAG
jgi:two-component sensor histidine kinase